MNAFLEKNILSIFYSKHTFGEEYFYLLFWTYFLEGVQVGNGYPNMH